MKSLMEAAQSRQSYVVKIRREFHRHPETRHETVLTRRRILKEVDSLVALNHGNVVIRPPRELRGGIMVDIDIEGSHDCIRRFRRPTGARKDGTELEVTPLYGHTALLSTTLRFSAVVSALLSRERTRK